MTIEKRIVVETSDVIAVTLECRNCGARLSSSPEKFHIPTDCPQCQREWLHGDQRSFQSQTSQHTNFIQALKQLRAEEENYSPFRILLEFQAPELPAKSAS